MKRGERIAMEREQYSSKGNERELDSSERSGGEGREREGKEREEVGRRGEKFISGGSKRQGKSVIEASCCERPQSGCFPPLPHSSLTSPQPRPAQPRPAPLPVGVAAASHGGIRLAAGPGVKYISRLFPPPFQSCSLGKFGCCSIYYFIEYFSDQIIL